MNNPIPAQISQIKTMSKWVRITIDTQETLTPEQKSELFDVYEKFGYFYFQEAPEIKVKKEEELPEIHLEEGEKSPSVRLRAVLFRYWEQNRQGTVDFEIFYRQAMEKLINFYKEKLA